MSEVLQLDPKRGARYATRLVVEAAHDTELVQAVSTGPSGRRLLDRVAGDVRDAGFAYRSFKHERADGPTVLFVADRVDGLPSEPAPGFVDGTNCTPVLVTPSM